MVIVNSKQPALPCNVLVVNHLLVSVAGSYVIHFRENDGDDDDDDDDDGGGVAPAA
ncbi:uncharacterized protein J3R85_005868 [Psidium guajava]|nr:uncharacterized protein J3R85_005868 [Psidium guajava]